MTRHSKHNCAGSVFTYAEKQMVAKHYGTQQMVVGRDSLRNFDACILCLQTARDPVACTKGHIGCKECFYECILTQKKELQRLKDLPSVSTPSAADVKKDAEEAAKMKQFMAAQSALPGAQTGASRSDGKVLPSFWIPALTPDLGKKDSNSEQKSVVCPMGSDHQLHVKKLCPVRFSESPSPSSSKKDDDKYMCKACSKTLTNSLKLVLIRGCGHVVCQTCCTKFVKSTGRCFVCEEKCKDKDLISLHNEGTGYANEGGVAIKKYDHAFHA